MQHDWGQYIEVVATALLGKPTSRTRKELRYGSKGSFKVNLETGWWDDWEGGEAGKGGGGGVLALIKREKGLEPAEAVAWMRDHLKLDIPDDREPRRTSISTSVGDDRPEPPWDGEPESDPAPKQKEKLVKVYDYVDRAGNLLFQVCRYEPKTFRQRRKPRADDPLEDIKGGWVWKRDGITQVPYRLPELLEAIGDERLIFLCYTPDTEVLTPDGWRTIVDIDDTTSVAQWDMNNGSIRFGVPSSKQTFSFSGKLIHIRSDWCDLMVTPDHRQPTRYYAYGIETEPKVLSAEKVRQGHKLPVAGLRVDSGHGPSEFEARIISAWLADGVRAARGDRVSWNLKKSRKHVRLRELLTGAGIAWTEHRYPSTPGWIDFRIARKDLSFVWTWVGESKCWPWSALDWPLAARRAAIDEICRWDGDSTTKNGSRFFTGDRQSADVVSAMAVTSGRSAASRVDHRHGRNDTYVVNMVSRTWRQLAKTPKSVAYTGSVHCCTVETGFLLVRRNGKITISGNCEGEKDVDALLDLGVPATTIAGGAGKWPDGLEPYFNNADIVILPDNDPQTVQKKTGEPLWHADGRPRLPGQDHAKLVASKLIGIAKSIRVLPLPDLPIKGDTTDWLDAGGTSEKLYKLVETAMSPAEYQTYLDIKHPPKVFVSKFGAVIWGRWPKQKVKYEYLIKGMIPRRETVLIYGASQSGKSFLTNDLGMTIARGGDAEGKYCGRRVRRGIVVYCAPEAGAGFLAKRVPGYSVGKGVPLDQVLPFVCLPARLDLFANEKQIDELIEEIKHHVAELKKLFPELELEAVVIDTFNKATTGLDEISGKDMSTMLKRFERISDALNTGLWIVHHKNGAGTAPRGHTSLYAGFETAIEVSRPDEKLRCAAMQKQREGQDGGRFNFFLRGVKTGEKDEDGDDITSCVVEWIDKDHISKARQEREAAQENRFTAPEMTAQRKALYRALKKAVEEYGVPPPPELKLPKSIARVVDVKFWRQVWKERSDDEKWDSARKALERQNDYLQNTGWIGRSNPWVWITDKEAEYRRAKAKEANASSSNNVVQFPRSEPQQEALDAVDDHFGGDDYNEPA